MENSAAALLNLLESLRSQGHDLSKAKVTFGDFGGPITWTGSHHIYRDDSELELTSDLRD